MQDYEKKFSLKVEKIISYLLHPVLFSTISAILYFIIRPKYLPKTFEYKILMVIFISTYVIPILFLFILKQRKTIEDFHLKTIKERKLPILFFTTITLLLAFRLLEIKVVNLLAFSFFGASLSMIIIFSLFFIKLKTSLHTLAIGGLTGFVMILSFHYKIRLLLLISILFLLFGVIAFARLKLKVHTNKEVYFGYFIGIFSQFFVYHFFPILLT